MTFLQFKTAVGEMINRDPTVGFLPNQIKIAANAAKQWAQQTHSFDKLEIEAKLVVTQANGGLLSAAQDLASAAVKVRKVKRFYAPSVDNPNVFYPVEALTRDQQVEALNAVLDSVSAVDVKSNTFLGMRRISAVQQGDKITLWPWSAQLLGTSATIQMDIIKWLPDYVNDADTDIFIDELTSWTLARTIYQMNYFLKDDQRFPVDVKKMEDLWTAVKNWDSSLTGGSFPITLD